MAHGSEDLMQTTRAQPPLTCTDLRAHVCTQLQEPTEVHLWGKVQFRGKFYRTSQPTCPKERNPHFSPRTAVSRHQLRHGSVLNSHGVLSILSENLLYGERIHRSLSPAHSTSHTQQRRALTWASGRLPQGVPSWRCAAEF